MTYPDTLSLSVTIAGNEVKTYIDGGEIRYKDVLSALSDTWTLTLVDPAVVPDDWDEIIVFNGAERLMAGYVITVEKLRMDKNYSKSIHYRLSCGGYASYLERVRVKEEYEDKTDAYIINDILTTYAADYDSTTYVTALKTYTNKRFNRKTAGFPDRPGDDRRHGLLCRNHGIDRQVECLLSCKGDLPDDHILVNREN